MAAAAFSGVSACRNLDQLRGGHQGVLRIAAHHGSRSNEIACSESCYAGTEFFDGSRGLAARHERERCLVLALAEVGLNEVDASGFNADQHLARAGMWNGQFDQLKNLWPAGLLNLDGFHIRVSMNP